MNKSHAQKPSMIPLRRKDRAIVDESWIERMLEVTPFAVVAIGNSNFPHLHTNTFVYDRSDHSIYFHTAREGSTRLSVGEGVNATLSISAMGRLLPAKTATQMSVEYQSVQIKGRISIVADLETCRTKMQQLVSKYFSHLVPGKDYAYIGDDELAKIAVYKISIMEWAGKQKRERDDFPGAFRYTHRIPD